MAKPRASFARRAALRRRAIEDIPEPQTTGPESKVASLVFTGVPAGAVGKAAKFVPKGMKAVTKVYKPSKEFLEALSRKAHKLVPKVVKGGR